MQSLSELFESGALRTPQIMWVAGYVSCALVMWFLHIEGQLRRWKFRYSYLAVAAHMTVVSMWSALITVSAGMPPQALSIALSVTTAGMIFGAIYGFFSRDTL